MKTLTKNPLSLLSFLLGVQLILLVTAGFFREKKKDLKYQALPVSAEALKKADKIQLIRGDETIEMLRDGNIWRLERPFKDRLDQKEVSRWLDYLGHLSPDKRISPSGSLKTGKLHLSVFMGERVFELNQVIFEPTAALQETATGQLQVYNPSRLKFLETPLSQLRSRSVFDMPEDFVKRIEIDEQGRQIGLELKNGTWEISYVKEDDTYVGAAKKMKVLSAKVLEYVRFIRGLRCSGIYENEHPDLETLKLKNPELKVFLELKNGKKGQIIFGAITDDDKRYLKSDFRGGAILELPRRSVQSFFPPAQYFINKKLWEINPKQILEMKFKFPDHSVTFRRDDLKSEWIYIEALRQRLDQNKVDRLLRRFSRLSAGAFFDEKNLLPAKTGLGSTATLFSLKFADGKKMTAKIGNALPLGDHYFYLDNRKIYCIIRRAQATMFNFKSADVLPGR